MIHFEPFLYTVRFYDEGKSYENRDPYRAVMTLFISGSLARAMAMHGKVTRGDFRNLFIELNKLNVKTLSIERGNKDIEYNISEMLKKL